MGTASSGTRYPGAAASSTGAFRHHRGDPMIRPDAGLRVYLCREPVDMRMQIDGLALLVQEAMELNPF